MTKKFPSRGPYPYPLPPLSDFHRPSATELKQLDPWNVQEFFRIEALLRCDTVLTLYQAEKGVTERVEMTLMHQYEFNMKWALHRSHDRYMWPWNWRTDEERPIRASRGLRIRSYGELFDDPYMVDVLERIVKARRGRKKDDLGDIPERFICLLIDRSLHPDVIINDLKTVLALLQGRRARIKKPYQFKVSSWIKYLDCYDLWRQNQNLSFGDIARKVYGTRNSQSYERAETAVKRVRQLIAQAESNHWPPKIK